MYKMSIYLQRVVRCMQRTNTSFSDEIAATESNKLEILKSLHRPFRILRVSLKDYAGHLGYSRQYAFKPMQPKKGLESSLNSLGPEIAYFTPTQNVSPL